MGGGQGDNNTVIRKEGWGLNVGGGLGGGKFKIGASFAGMEQLDGQGGRFTFQTRSGWKEDYQRGGHQLPFKGGLNSEEDRSTWKCWINKLRSWGAAGRTSLVTPGRVGVGETLWGFGGISLLGLSGDNSNPPTAHCQHPAPSSPKVGIAPAPTPHPQRLGPNETAHRQQWAAWGCPSPPHPVSPKSPALWPRRAGRNKRQHKTQGSPPVRWQRQQRVKQERQGNHTPALSLPLSSSSSASKSLSLVCLFVLSKVHRARREGEFRGSEGWSLPLVRWAPANVETSGQVRTNEEVYEGLTTGKGSPRT